MDVIAKTQGFYGGKVRERGERFTIASEKDLGRWMLDLSTEAGRAYARRAPAPVSTTRGHQRLGMELDLELGRPDGTSRYAGKGIHPDVARDADTDE